MTILTVVTAALIDSDGRILLTQRPKGKFMAGLWEFPGGKIKSGEIPEIALIRELDEELAIKIDSSCLAPLFFASHNYTDFHLLMLVFACRRWQGIVTPLEQQRLTWVKANALKNYSMPAANIPLIAMIRDWL